MKAAVGSVVCVAAASLSAGWLQAAPPLRDVYRFCVPDAENTWRVQSYRPLIDVRGQSFLELRYTGRWLSLVRSRAFDPKAEFAAEYRFNEAGELQSITVMLRKWGGWVAQSKVYPTADGGFEPFQVEYLNRMNGQSITTPEYVTDPTPRFKRVKVYRTTREVPCAGLPAVAEIK